MVDQNPKRHVHMPYVDGDPILDEDNITRMIHGKEQRVKIDQEEKDARI